MDALKALKSLKDKLKTETKEVAGGNKYVKRSAIEEARLKRLREEEEKERQEKEEKRRKLQEATRQLRPLDRTLSTSSSQDLDESLTKAEVIRRLRALGQPATLFGEEDVERWQRLRRAEKEMNVEDDARGGEAQINTLNEMKRQEKLKKKGGLAQQGDKEGGSGGEEQQADPAAASSSSDPLMAAFEAAAARVAEQRADDQLAVEDRILKYLKKWSREWDADMEARPEEVKQSGPGGHATKVFKQTMMYLEPLYNRLKKRRLEDELRNGLWMMVRDMRDRNYLAAYDVYLKLAIGNAPWPIGVTSVGIHERSAREKISHVMNAQGQAHIMNDEATRKFLQAMKRLITFVQRMHPTDPSRSVDFSTVADATRGAAGGGSDKLALLEAEAKGNDWKTLGLPAPPHFMEKDGSVKVPPKWENIISRALDGDATPPRTKTPPPGKTPPATPPHAQGAAAE